MQSNANSLGLKAPDVVTLTRMVKAGFSYEALRRFQLKSRLSLATVGKVIQIPPRTLARRKSTGKLTRQESERLLRVARLYDKAAELCDGDAAAATAWLSAPSRALGGHSPLEMAETEIGAREVEDLIGRLEHGVFS